MENRLHLPLFYLGIGYHKLKYDLTKMRGFQRLQESIGDEGARFQSFSCFLHLTDPWIKYLQAGDVTL